VQHPLLFQFSGKLPLERLSSDLVSPDYVRWPYLEFIGVGELSQIHFNVRLNETNARPYDAINNFWPIR
jgi:hypothetical protein